MDWSEVLEDLQVLWRHRRVFLPVFLGVYVKVGRVALVGNFRDNRRLWRQWITSQAVKDVKLDANCSDVDVFYCWCCISQKQEMKAERKCDHLFSLQEKTLSASCRFLSLTLSSSSAYLAKLTLNFHGVKNANLPVWNHRCKTNDAEHRNIKLNVELSILY